MIAVRDLPVVTSIAPAVVVRVGDRPEPDLVLTLFALGATMNVATVNVEEATAADWSAIDAWIADKCARVVQAGTLAPGYYLFAEGCAVAWESGLPDPFRDYLALGAGIASALLGAHYRSKALTASAPILVTTQAALRTIRVLMQAIADAQPRTVPSAAADQSGGLAAAFAVLDVESDASHAVVKARYRALAKEWHPDRFHGNPATADEASARMTSINVAYAVICSVRGW